jgi:hypothetical protein
MGVGVGEGVKVGVGVSVGVGVEVGGGVAVAVTVAVAVVVGVAVGATGVGALHAFNKTNTKRLIRKNIRDLIIFTPTIWFNGFWLLNLALSPRLGGDSLATPSRARAGSHESVPVNPLI